MSWNAGDTNASLKLAVAVALFRSKLLSKPPNLSSSSSAAPPDESKALRWKRKAKQRKQELLRLKEDLKEAEDGLQYDLFSQGASCKCYFFDDLGKLSPARFGDDSDNRFSDVLRRRFLRQVRLKERKRKKSVGSIQPRRFSDFCIEDEEEQLRASADFLVELCSTVFPVKMEANLANWSHQAIDIILALLKNLLATGRNNEGIEVIISNFIMHLVRRVCSPLQGDESHHSDADPQIYVQHLIRKLGREPYIGQRAILSVSQRISVLAESLLFLDPFDDAFPNMHSSMFILIQLVEFLVSDYLIAWSKDESFDNVLFEEWVTSVVHARKALQLLESRNGLYVLYIDRVIGELAKQAGQVSLLQDLNPDIVDKLLC